MKRGHYDLEEFERLLVVMNNRGVPDPVLWRKLSSAYREVLEDVEKLEEREEQLEKGWRDSDDRLIKQIEELDKDNADLHDEISQRRGHAAEYRLKIAELEQQIQSLNSAVEELAQKNKDLNKEVMGNIVGYLEQAEKDASRIADLEKRLEGYETKANSVDTLEEAEAKANALIREKAVKDLPVFKVYGDNSIQVHYGSSMEVFDYVEPWVPKVFELIKCYANDGSTHLRVFSEKKFGSYIDTSGASWLKVEPASIEDIKAVKFKDSCSRFSGQCQSGDSQ